MMERVEILLLGCPVCRQRKRHLVFCRYRPGPIHPLVIALSLAAPFWIVAYLVGGFAAIGILATAGFLAELGVFFVATRERPTYGPPYREEIVGELYPVTPITRPAKKARRRNVAA